MVDRLTERRSSNIFLPELKVGAVPPPSVHRLWRFAEHDLPRKYLVPEVSLEYRLKAVKVFEDVVKHAEGWQSRKLPHT